MSAPDDAVLLAVQRKAHALVAASVLADNDARKVAYDAIEPDEWKLVAGCLNSWAVALTLILAQVGEHSPEEMLARTALVRRRCTGERRGETAGHPLGGDAGTVVPKPGRTDCPAAEGPRARRMPIGGRRHPRPLAPSSR